MVQAAADGRRSVVGGRSGDFRAGFVATLPLWLGAAPFGAIYAVSALAAGLDWTQTLAMSLFVFAGASQFTAVGLFAAGASPFTIVLTTLIINARHAPLAASVAPFLRDARPSAKALLAFQLTDESYAIAMRRWLRWQRQPGLPVRREYQHVRDLAVQYNRRHSAGEWKRKACCSSFCGR